MTTTNPLNLFVYLLYIEGGVYDPADIDLVNKLNGVGPEDLTPAVLASFNDDEGDALDAIGGFK